MDAQYDVYVNLGSAKNNLIIPARLKTRNPNIEIPNKFEIRNSNVRNKSVVPCSTASPTPLRF